MGYCRVLFGEVYPAQAECPSPPGGRVFPGPTQRRPNTYLADSGQSPASGADLLEVTIDTIDKHSRLPRKFTPVEHRTEEERAKRTPVPIEKRQLILEDAKERIMAGDDLYQIAERHGIARRTLCYWLAAMGDEYQELRRAWIDAMLAEAAEKLEETDESGNAPLRLARARELWKKATWYAERRDRQRYGEDKANLNLNITPQLTIITSDQHNTIEHEHKDTDTP